MTDPDPRPLSEAELDEMDRLAKEAQKANAPWYGPPTVTGANSVCASFADLTFIAACTPARIASLVALARRGAEREHVCGHRPASGVSGWPCGLLAGHEGAHQNGFASWPAPPVTEATPI